jgi:hypothetical protein
VYCPRCGVEYREGFTECADCRVALVAGMPEPAKELPDPGLELVTVLEGDDPLLINLAKASLTEADIPFFVLGEELGLRLGPVGSFIQPWRRIQVAADREQEARELLQQIGEYYQAGESEEESG